MRHSIAVNHTVLAVIYSCGLVACVGGDEAYESTSASQLTCYTLDDGSSYCTGYHEDVDVTGEGGGGSNPGDWGGGGGEGEREGGEPGVDQGGASVDPHVATAQTAITAAIDLLNSNEGCRFMMSGDLSSDPVGMLQSVLGQGRVVYAAGGLGGPTAQAANGTIWVAPDFYNYSQAKQAFIILHELGHLMTSTQDLGNGLLFNRHFFGPATSRGAEKESLKFQSQGYYHDEIQRLCSSPTVDRPWETDEADL